MVSVPAVSPVPSELHLLVWELEGSPAEGEEGDPCLRTCRAERLAQGSHSSGHGFAVSLPQASPGIS